MQKKNNPIKKIGTCILAIALLCALTLIILNRLVVAIGDERIISEEAAAALTDVDCVLILGAGVYNNSYPSHMLEDRLLEGIRLYQFGVSNRLLMSGDNGRIDYNEVKVMKDFAVSFGVPSAHIFQDHAGFSTYESMYRARDVFAAQKIVIVTQKYHMYRALYTARALGLDAYGVISNPRTYHGQTIRDLREILARAKDAVYCLFKPLPTFLGDVIPVGGNGDMIG